jgi:hypothetical protein
VTDTKQGKPVLIVDVDRTLDDYIPTYAGTDPGARLTNDERESLSWRIHGDAGAGLSEGLVFAVECIIADRVAEVVNAVTAAQNDRREALAMWAPERNIAVEAHVSSIDAALAPFVVED